MGTDLRVLKTQRALKTALLKIIKDKPVGNITTTELCREAGINRNTFYAHYSSPVQLLETIEDEYIVKLLEIVNSSLQPDNYSYMLRQVLETVKEDKEVTALLLSENGTQTFLTRIIETMKGFCLELWQTQTRLSRQEQEMLYYYATYGTQKCIFLWAESNFQELPEIVADRLAFMTETLVNDVINRNLKK